MTSSHNEIQDINTELTESLSQERIRSRIYTMREMQVMLDRDLAECYGVTTGALNQAVKRNIGRFPERFMFQMSQEEFENWKSQIVITNSMKMGCYVNQRHVTSVMRQAFAQYNAQYPTEHVELHTFNRSHDRWLIIDDTVYHFGASIKDLGKKWFSVDIVTEHTANELIARITV